MLPASFFRKGCLKSRFWWGQKSQEKKIHKLSWPKFCMPKTMGGIGFRNPHSFNIAMLVKQGWRLYKNMHSLFKQVYKSHYFPNTSILDATLPKYGSLAWTSIAVARFVLKNGLR